MKRKLPRVLLREGGGGLNVRVCNKGRENCETEELWWLRNSYDSVLCEKIGMEMVGV